MQWLELKIPPLVVWFIFAFAMFGVAYVAPGLSYTLPGSFILAMVLLVVGGVAALAGVTAFRSKRTTVNPLIPGASSAVVSSSVYRVSRSPMYLGFLLALSGCALYLSNSAAAMLLPAFLAYLTQFQTKPEERALLAKFGPEFAQYMARVPRWL